MKSRTIVSIISHVAFLVITALGCAYRVLNKNDYSYFSARMFFSYYALIEPIIAGIAIALVSVLRTALSTRFRISFYVICLFLWFLYLFIRYLRNGSLYTALYKERLLFVETSFVVAQFAETMYCTFKSKNRSS